MTTVSVSKSYSHCVSIGLRLEVFERACRPDARRLAVEAARLHEVVGLVPEAAVDLVVVARPSERRHEAFAREVVLRRADRERRTTRRRRVRRAPQSLALVTMPVGRRRPRQRVAERQVERHVAQVVLAQARRVPVRVVAGDGVVLAARVARVRGIDRREPVRVPVIPVVAAARDDVLRQVLIIDLDAIGVVVEERELAFADRVRELEVVLANVLIALALPFLRGAIRPRRS